MTDTLSAVRPGLGGVPSAAGERRLGRMLRASALAAVLMIGLGIARFDAGRPEQLYIGACFAVLAALFGAWIWAPRGALAVMIALTLIGDIVTVSWFPFNKNLSSAESIMYVNDQVSFSPLELTLVWAMVVTGYRNLSRGGSLFRTAPLVKPLAVFGAFVVLGFVSGMSRGGDFRIALIEARALLYLPLLYLLIVNVCRTWRDYAVMFGAAAVGVVIQAWLSLRYVDQLPPGTREALVDLNEHGSAISMNLVFVLLAVSVVFKRIPMVVRIGLLLASIPIMQVYLIAQRRAAVVTLLLAIVVLGVQLFWRQRRTFWKIVPITAIVVVGYVGAFWSVESNFPAQAVKGALSQDVSEADQSSNWYRDAENYNLVFTIRTEPLTGIGFGHKFYRPFPLPDIGFFSLNEYLSHNSLLWIWVKLGFGGFVTMLYFFARALLLGSARARAAPDGMSALVATTALAFVLMFTVFVFVEIAWEPRNVMLLALSMAACTAPIVSREDPDHPEVETADQTAPPTAGAVSAQA